MARHFQNWLEAYVEYCSNTEAPLKFLWWSGISTLASALRRHIWLDMGHFQWTPNFYIVFVAPPGIVTKSTIADIGSQLIKRLPQVKLGPSNITWQALAQRLPETTEAFITPSGLHETMSPMTFISSELGVLLDPSDTAMVEFLIHLWDGRKDVFEKNTKTQGSDKITNTWINILACTTPAWIAERMPLQMIGGGFTSRCIFVYADEKRQFLAYPKKYLSAAHQALGTKLVEDLNHISNLIGEIHLSHEAEEWGETWYEKHWKNRRTDSLQMQGYWSRKQTHLHKLAMVLQISHSDSLTVDLQHLTFAASMLDALESDMERVFQFVGQNDSARAQSDLMRYLRGVGPMSKKILFVRFAAKTMNWNQFEEALKGCIFSGMVKEQNENGEIKLTPRQDEAL